MKKIKNDISKEDSANKIHKAFTWLIIYVCAIFLYVSIQVVLDHFRIISIPNLLPSFILKISGYVVYLMFFVDYKELNKNKKIAIPYYGMLINEVSVLITIGLFGKTHMLSVVAKLIFSLWLLLAMKKNIIKLNINKHLFSIIFILNIICYDAIPYVSLLSNFFGGALSNLIILSSGIYMLFSYRYFFPVIKSKLDNFLIILFASWKLIISLLIPLNIANKENIHYFNSLSYIVLIIGIYIFIKYLDQLYPAIAKIINPSIKKATNAVKQLLQDKSEEK